MGQLGFNSGIAVRLYDAANKFIGHVPGGLAMATVLGATGFKTICGSSAATAATFAGVASEMDRFGYDKRFRRASPPWAAWAASSRRASCSSSWVF
jgi:TRAP-type C4-dicarboxylate transport system permease large subunit